MKRLTVIAAAALATLQVPAVALAQQSDFAPMAPSPGGGFLLFMTLWGVIPAIICGFIANERRVNVGIAVLIGIIGGWLGLLFVAIAYKPEVKRAASNIIDNAQRPTPRASVSTPPRRNTATRLAELDGLKQKGIITDSEYDSRREGILSEI